MKMTWAETIEYIRKDPSYAVLVKLAYFEKDLPLNVERFLQTSEWKKTLSTINQHQPGNISLLDVGCGAGFTSIAFALQGMKVTSLEPDPDDSIGYGAINKLAAHYNCKIEICPKYFEVNDLASGSFDVVYARQSMHHAGNLESFVAEAYRLLKPGGILLTVRDHVVDDQKEMETFLKEHPLQKFYGGENAFSEKEYLGAMTKAGFEIMKVWRYYDSVINFFPLKEWKVKAAKLKNAILFFRPSNLQERNLAGRMYSFLATKKN